ncbi:MAG: histidinol dehydrogenase [Capsulimonadales bacterium]|nr:histidinol dehydrogenase [Capsulimonadales bacterium]
MRTFDTRSTPIADLGRLFDERLEAAAADAEEAVREILADVRNRGDAAVLDYTRRFDYPHAENLRVPEERIEEAAERIARTPLQNALEQAAQRIRVFHEKHRRTSWIDAERPGETLGQIVRPLAQVGIYVPGGTADYPSTVLMTCIPAAVAGVGRIAVATPPNRETGLPPIATLAALRIAGVTEVYAMGGAQAIAAFAFGTRSVARVDKVFGPGNVYVNLAKKMVYGMVGVDLLAGPSEVAVLADEAGDPVAAAADILTQCEHDTNSSALVVSPSEAFLQAVREEIARQATTLPRGEIARQALAAHGFCVLTRDLSEAAAVVSRYAPEHLHLDTREPYGLLGAITNAGAILIGRHTSAPLGDYVAGPSHTLPTAGCARFASPLNIDDFTKKTSLLAFSADAASALSEAAVVFAEFEGLEGHARAARRHR